MHAGWILIYGGFKYCVQYWHLQRRLGCFQNWSWDCNWLCNMRYWLLLTQRQQLDLLFWHQLWCRHIAHWHRQHVIQWRLCGMWNWRIELRRQYSQLLSDHLSCRIRSISNYCNHSLRLPSLFCRHLIPCQQYWCNMHCQHMPIRYLSI